MMFPVPVCAHRSPFFSRWHDIANMSHNKSFFALELASKEETIQFQTVSEQRHFVTCFSQELASQHLRAPVCALGWEVWH